MKVYVELGKASLVKVYSLEKKKFFVAVSSKTATPSCRRTAYRFGFRAGQGGLEDKVKYDKRTIRNVKKVVDGT